MGKFSIRAADAPPQGATVKIDGELSVTEVDDFERQLMGLAERPGAQLVLDLSGLTFAASLAIGCLLRFRSRVIAAGGRVALAEVQPLVLESFRRAQLHRVFTICPTVADALKDDVAT